VPASFEKDRMVKLGEERIHSRFLAERVTQNLKDRPSQDVYVGPDGNLRVQSLIDVMDLLKSGGVERVMIATSPRDGRRAP
jgi:biopolymer transport protein ExbD